MTTTKLDLDEAERLLQGLRANRPFFEPDFFRFCLTFVPLATARIRELELERSELRTLLQEAYGRHENFAWRQRVEVVLGWRASDD